VYLFPYLVRGKNNKLHAFWFGVVLAVIMFIPTGLVVRSIWKVDFNSIFLMNTLAHLIIGGVLGIISSLIYNYKKNETN
jgi:undecaprenyl pyrophosphate phosphatase UppP